MATRSKYPFAWPQKVPKNADIPVLVANDEEDLKEGLRKYVQTSAPVLLGTHNGCFHADEVLACVLLKYANILTADGVIVRTRSNALLEKMNVVVDVGLQCNPAKRWYDHHQKDYHGIVKSEI
jgi:hypothetical protein